MKLSCHNLGWSTPTTDIVKNITLRVEPGEIIGVVGQNGSGKSTLLKMLSGILTPTSGTIMLDGSPMHKMRQRDIAQRLALVRQQAETDERITVKDVVELGRTPWLSALRAWKAEDDLIVNQALQSVSMQGFENRFWQTLSGGERQRVHIARALSQQPQILVLDEPTNHLDIRQQIAILDMVTNLGVTSIIALHDLNQATVCDRLCVMQEGEMVACGPPNDILTNEIFQSAFGVKARFLHDPEDGKTVIRFLPHC
jgi:iron complex transport system ATP-binding protein